MISDSILQSGLRNERNQFAQTLQSFVLIDVGTITSVSEDGRAEVRTNIFAGDQQVIYQNAEVIYPGNQGGAYTSAVAGTSCLIFIPRSCMPDVKNQVVQFGAAPYDKTGVKVMPISNGVSDGVRTLFSTIGAYSIYSSDYSVTFDTGSVTLLRKDGNVNITVNQKGYICVEWHNAAGASLSYMIDDNGIHKTWLSPNKDVLWTDTQNPDGSRSFVQTNPQNQDSDPLFSMTIGTNGAVTIGVATSISVSGNTTIDVDGDASISADNIKLNGDSKKLVTYDELDTALTKFTTALQTHVHECASPGSPSLGPTVIPPMTLDIDISAAATNTIKTGG